MVTDFVMNYDWLLENRFGEEKKVMNDIWRTIHSLDPLNLQVDDMMTVVSELCLNAFEHGNCMNPDTRVHVAMSVDDHIYRIRVYDAGDGFQYVPHSRLVTHIDNNKTRGWGLHLISSLADQVITGFKNNLFFVEVHFQRIGGMNHARK